MEYPIEKRTEDIRFTGERLVMNTFVKQNYGHVLEEHIQRYKLACKYVQTKNILDAACGSGYGSEMMAQAGASHTVGLDISDESVKSANKKYGSEKIEFIVGDINHLSYKAETFDVVISFETIEHISNGDAWIKESARVLKDGGLFIISTPNRYMMNPGAYFEDKPKNPYHIFEYNIYEFAGALLKEYEIIDLYGQIFCDELLISNSRTIRMIKKIIRNYIPTQKIKNVINQFRRGHSTADVDCTLIPFGDVQNKQPLFIIAVCRKKHKVL